MLGSSFVRSRLRGSLVLALLLVIALLGGTPAGAHPEEEGQQRRGEHGADAAQAEPGESEGVRVLGHADPGGGFHADIVAHKGYAYLGSWGAGAARCPSRGVRVFDLSDLSNPEHVATFADGFAGPDVGPQTALHRPTGLAVGPDGSLYLLTDKSDGRVLRVVRETTPGRVFCVFGAGGDRDRAKRPFMGRARREASRTAACWSSLPDWAPLSPGVTYGSSICRGTRFLNAGPG